MSEWLHYFPDKEDRNWFNVGIGVSGNLHLTV
jgi:hypothetical protein